MTPDEMMARARMLEWCADRLRLDADQHSQPAYDVGATTLDTLAYDLRRDARLQEADTAPAKVSWLKAERAARRAP